MSNTFLTKTDENFLDCETLASADTNTQYIITHCSFTQPLLTRFAELGFVENARIVLLGKAPLGDPLIVSVAGYAVCIRANEAKHIHVSRCASEQA